MEIFPTGDKVLIRLEKAKAYTEGGIALPDETVRSDQFAAVKGKVERIGKLAWSEWGNGERWANEGDMVLFQQYAGMRIPDKRGRIIPDLVLVLDRDITAVVTEGEE